MPSLLPPATASDLEQTVCADFSATFPVPSRAHAASGNPRGDAGLRGHHRQQRACMRACHLRAAERVCKVLRQDHRIPSGTHSRVSTDSGAGSAEGKHWPKNPSRRQLRSRKSGQASQRSSCSRAASRRWFPDATVILSRYSARIPYPGDGRYDFFSRGLRKPASR